MDIDNVSRLRIEMNLIQEIEDELFAFLKPYKEKYKKENFNFSISNNTNPLGIDFTHKQDKYFMTDMLGLESDKSIVEENDDNNKLAEGKMLRAHIYTQYNQIQIPNIYIPHFMKKQGIGKKIISIIFKLAEKYNYELFIVDMVPSFYERLIKRGALPCVGDGESLQIVKDTKLE
ncbi:hypothetical protein [Tissierella sp.]|uniref:hypothetical protein n=1 Tax=Tissierella sp. TaxID=41274 RepID=UPI00305E61DA